MDRTPDFSTYSINELYEALNRLDRVLYPEREKQILKFLAERENQYLPEDYSLRQLLRMRKKMVKKGDSSSLDFNKLDEEIKRRQADADYAERALPAYVKGRINWKLIVVALVVVGGLFATLSQLTPPISPDAPVVKDALFLAQRAGSSQRLIGDSLILEGVPSGTLTEQQEGWISTGNVDMAIPVKGDSGNGTLTVVGELGKGGWDFSTLNLQLSGSDSVITLLPELLQTAGLDSSSVE